MVRIDATEQPLRLSLVCPSTRRTAELCSSPSQHELSSAGKDGQYLHGWERQFDFLSSKWAGIPQSERIAQAMWRGRTEDAEFPKRDAMRCAMPHFALLTVPKGRLCISRKDPKFPKRVP